jgi:hypothetical protein
MFSSFRKCWPRLFFSVYCMAANVGNGALELRDFASVWQPLLALNRDFIGKGNQIRGRMSLIIGFD